MSLGLYMTQHYRLSQLFVPWLDTAGPGWPNLWSSVLVVWGDSCQCCEFHFEYSWVSLLKGNLEFAHRKRCTDSKIKGLMLAVLERFMVTVELQMTLSGLSCVQMSASTISDAYPYVLQTLVHQGSTVYDKLLFLLACEGVAVDRWSSVWEQLLCC